jgi:hypothetical protein
MARPGKRPSTSKPRRATPKRVSIPSDDKYNVNFKVKDLFAPALGAVGTALLARNLYRRFKSPASEPTSFQSSASLPSAVSDAAILKQLEECNKAYRDLQARNQGFVDWISFANEQSHTIEQLVENLAKAKLLITKPPVGGALAGARARIRARSRFTLGKRRRSTR